MLGENSALKYLTAVIDLVYLYWKITLISSKTGDTGGSGVFQVALLSDARQSKQVETVEPQITPAGHLTSWSPTMTTITRNLPWFIRDFGVSIVGQVIIPHTEILRANNDC